MEVCAGWTDGDLFCALVCVGGEEEGRDLQKRGRKGKNDLPRGRSWDGMGWDDVREGTYSEHVMMMLVAVGLTERVLFRILCVLERQGDAVVELSSRTVYIHTKRVFIVP